MKITRLLAASTGIAIAGALVATALPATANPGDACIHTADIGAEGDSSPAQWFKGDDDAPASAVDDAYGLTITGDYQLLNGANLGTGTSIEDLVAGASVVVSQGAAAFQILIFARPGQTQVGFTTLRPNAFNVPGESAVPSIDTPSVRSQNIYAADGTTIVYPATSVAPLSDFLAAIGDGYQILASGVFVNEVTGSNSIAAITRNGLTTRFTPKPNGSTEPATLTPAQFADSGVVATLTGFVPGEDVDLELTGPISTTGTETADVDGVVAVPVTLLAGEAQPGTYAIVATGVDSLQSVTTGFVITDPAAVVTPAADAGSPATLAETGVESSMGLLTAAALVFVRLALVLVRRRANAIDAA